MESPIYNPDTQRDDPHLVSLQDNLKEKVDVWRRLKKRILNDLSNLQFKRETYERNLSLFRKRIVDAGQIEYGLKEELSEVKERLSILQVIKEREKKMSLRVKRKWLEAMKKLENQINDLKIKQKELEMKIRKIREDAEDLHSFEMKKFKQILADTERALDKIECERKRDENRLEE